MGTVFFARKEKHTFPSRLFWGGCWRLLQEELAKLSFKLSKAKHYRSRKPLIYILKNAQRCDVLVERCEVLVERCEVLVEQRCELLVERCEVLVERCELLVERCDVLVRSQVNPSAARDGSSLWAGKVCVFGAKV